MTKFLTLSLFVFTLCTVSCSTLHKKEKPVARVFDHYLYPSDYEHIFSLKATQQDSAQLINSFVESWIKNEVILHHAENSLSIEDQQTFNELIRKYRQSLIVFNFESKFIENDSNSAVSFDEINEYYTNYQKNFVTSECLVKAKYLILPITDKKISSYYVQKLTSNNDEEMTKFSDYCDSIAVNYKINDTWIPLREINTQLPPTNQLLPEKLSDNTFLDFNTDHYRYIIYLKEHVQANNISPLEYVEDNIRNIILNKRKQNRINEIEDSLYKTALDNNEIELY